MQEPRSLTEIHIAVLLFGLAGLFGKFIDLPAPLIVLGRAFFAATILGCCLLVSHTSARLNSNGDYLFITLLGALLAVHWIAFFQSIQISTVAVGLLTYSTFPIFTTFLEPIVFDEKLRSRDIVLAAVTLIGIALIIPKIELGSSTMRGAAWGVMSGASFAVLSTLNRRYVRHYSSLTISFHQNSVATIVLLPFLFDSRAVLAGKNILLLALLGVVFTAGSHTLFIQGMLRVKAQTASVIATLEPVYGIAFAAIFLHEVPSGRTIVGGTMIMAASFVASAGAGGSGSSDTDT